MSTEPDLIAVTERAVEAYNAQDWTAFEELFVEDLYFCHHNRGIEFHERGQLIETLRMFAKDLIPDRHFGVATRVLRTGNIVVREHSWNGTAIADVPDIAAEGESISLDLCTLYVFDGDRVSEYHDYG